MCSSRRRCWGGSLSGSPANSMESFDVRPTSAHDIQLSGRGALRRPARAGRFVRSGQLGVTAVAQHLDLKPNTTLPSLRFGRAAAISSRNSQLRLALATRRQSDDGTSAYQRCPTWALTA